MEDSRYRVPISEKERSFQHNPQLSILNSQFLLLLVSSIVIAIVLASCGFVANLDHDLEEQGLMADAEWLRDEISVPGLVLAVAEPGNDVLVAAAGFADLDGTIPWSLIPVSSWGSVDDSLCHRVAAAGGGGGAHPR